MTIVTFGITKAIKEAFRFNFHKHQLQKLLKIKRIRQEQCSILLNLKN